MIARPQKSVPVIASMFSSSRATKHVANGLGMPLAPARRSHTPRIECLSNLPQRRCTGLLGLSDDREDIGRVSVGFRHDSNLCVPAGHVELWATQGHPPGLCRRKGLTGARADQGTFLL